ncbi:MAG TPA: hypothetical protein VH814_25795 [Steroidobacteraceae bacterium]
MGRNIVAVIAGLAAWLAVATVAGLIMRESWPAYASVAEAMTFTLPMMIARLSIGAVATLVAGFVAALITRSAVARLLPGVILLIAFVPQHAMLWDKFPIWYHLTFLLSLVPLTYAGNLSAARLPSATLRSA